MEKIGNDAFQELLSLKNVSLTINLKTIGIHTFSYCILFNTIIFNSGNISNIGKDIFSYPYLYFVIFTSTYQEVHVYFFQSSPNFS